MVIFESRISSWALKRGFEVDLLARFSKVIPYILGFYLIVKFGDLAVSGKLNLLLLGRWETALFWAEILLGVVTPMILFSIASVRQSGTGLFLTASLVIAGVVMNRLDVGLLALARPAGSAYFPHWMEFAITASIISAGILAYWAVARYLPLYAEEEKHEHKEVEIATGTASAVR